MKHMTAPAANSAQPVLCLCKEQACNFDSMVTEAAGSF